ncbi:hypothetical protein BOTBODRAFT_535494 [Botryobasidium botryosum FD-172 SS1]|uniref:Uncharacterized protein n=1 Tax=Botryobasidium botryosum (strain FD-172 SS1) TaxID=930990 RepID=A0A067MB30_BOTB1|nr:hypothetical protein BOTBODRAFT_535494 [Botryobasidium botryosum FD-172 SS1]
MSSFASRPIGPQCWDVFVRSSCPYPEPSFRHLCLQSLRWRSRIGELQESDHFTIFSRSKYRRSSREKPGHPDCPGQCPLLLDWYICFHITQLVITTLPFLLYAALINERLVDFGLHYIHEALELEPGNLEH